MRKRSKYRPKPVALNPMAYVLENMTPVAKHESYLTDLKIKNSLAMATLLKGGATRADLDVIIAMSNISEVLQRLGFGKEYGEVTTAGREAIIAIAHRAVKIKRFVPTGPEIQALNTLMELHDAQMDVITIKDMDAALKLAKNLIRNKQATGLPSVAEIP